MSPSAERRRARLRRKLIRSFDTRGNGMIHSSDWMKLDAFDRETERMLAEALKAKKK